MTTVEVRPIRREEIDGYSAQLTRVFGGSRPSAQQLENMRQHVDLDRALGAFEAGSLVGTAGVVGFRLTVPGGDLDCAGVTGVSVLPTHRRRGLLRAMMRQQLDDIHGRGEPLAALYASQSGIYGRFGYGPATWHTRLRLMRQFSHLRVAPSEGLRLRFVERAEAATIADRVHRQIAPRHPGAAHRGPEYWELRYEDAPDRREGASELNHVAVEGAAGTEGLVTYRIFRPLPPPSEEGTVRVRDLLATTPAAYLDLWKYCTAVDLMTQVEATDRPVEEPFRLALADPRALRVSVYDGVWLRLVDVPAALSGRRYAQAGRLVIAVRDEFCPWNEGAYALEVEAGGEARCARSNAAPDLEIDVGDLGACYLGGTRFAALAAAGRLGGAYEVAMRADAMFRSQETPWCPTHF